MSGERHFQLTMPGIKENIDPAPYHEAFEDGLYDEVATIEGDDLEYVFTATNNGVLSDSWSRNPPPGVTPTFPNVHIEKGVEYGRRSTSVGDLVEKDGMLHLVAAIGFREIGPVPQPAARP